MSLEELEEEEDHESSRPNGAQGYVTTAVVSEESLEGEPSAESIAPADGALSSEGGEDESGDLMISRGRPIVSTLASFAIQHAPKCFEAFA